jgi:adenylate cyclase
MTTRRLAAILAADVVGFSRLMGEDEAGTLAALRDRRRRGECRNWLCN